MKKNRTYAGIPESLATQEEASIVLQSIPYDGTSTWGKGANHGFEAFLDASENMELFDIETDSEVYQKGVYMPPAITEASSPEAMYQAVYQQAKHWLDSPLYPTFFGGEHSVSIGIIDAFADAYPNLTVLQLDAHADLRATYMGSEFNHACALHRASQKTNLIQVGIRSMDASEKQWLNPEQCYFAHQMEGDNSWVNRSLNQMTENVYLTIDLDVFDPSIMPATGTPEPGGMHWYTVLTYLRQVFEQKNVVGFDMVELAPIKGLHAPQFLAAKLYYKLLSYKFFLP